MKNKTQLQSKYTGLTVALCSSTVGSVAFIAVYKLAKAKAAENPNHLFSNYMRSLPFFAATVSSSVSKLFLDVYKMQRQVGRRVIKIRDLNAGFRLSLMPVIIRDILFRGVYYSILNNLIVDFGYKDPRTRQARMRSENIWHSETFQTALRTMVIGIFLGTLVTMPVDTVISKLATQTYPKYTGFFDCFQKVIAQEGKAKLFTGMYARFGINLATLFVYNTYYEKLYGTLYYSVKEGLDDE